MEFSSSRAFQIWLYATGHSQLLLISNKEKTGDKRIAILFKDVSYVSMPINVKDISIKDMMEDTIGSIAGHETSKIYHIKYAGGRGHIAAGSFFLREDDGEFFDKVPFDLDLPPSLS